MYDSDRYRDREEIEGWKQRDPIELFRQRGRVEGWLGEADLEGIEREVAAEIEQAVRAAEEGPLEPVEKLTRDVLAREVP
jgi:pyruvate dehydrogenase E1 component alpha subunit